MLHLTQEMSQIQNFQCTINYAFHCRAERWLDIIGISIPKGNYTAYVRIEKAVIIAGI